MKHKRPRTRRPMTYSEKLRREARARDEARGAHADDGPVTSVYEAVEWILSMEQAWHEDQDVLARRITRFILDAEGGRDLSWEQDIIYGFREGIFTEEATADLPAGMTRQDLAEHAYRMMTRAEKEDLLFEFVKRYMEIVRAKMTSDLHFVQPDRRLGDG